MDERNNDFDFDFMPIGQAIKKAREARGMTREQLADFFEKIDNFFYFPYENGVLSGFYPFTSYEWGRRMYTPFYEKNFSSKNKKQPKSLYLRAFSAEKYFEFF